MRDYVIVCGSTVDMDEKKLTERGVEYIPFEFFIGDESFKDDLGKTMPYKEFYDRIRAGAVTRTSQINAETIRKIAKNPCIYCFSVVVYIRI